MTTHTHTYAVLEVSAEAYKEIRDKLEEAGYKHVFKRGSGQYKEVIHMEGIAIAAKEVPHGSQSS